MASFIARMFGGGKKKEESPSPSAPAPAPVVQTPVTQPASQARAKTESIYAGGIKSKRMEEEAKIAKKMLLGE